MADVKIFDRVEGGPMSGAELVQYLGFRKETQDEMDRVAGVIFGVATAARLEHWDQGHSEILKESGTMDRFVVLSDERGLQAAGAIEFGRKGRSGPVSGMGALAKGMAAVGARS